MSASTPQLSAGFARARFADPLFAALAAFVVAVALSSLRHPGLFSFGVFANLLDDNAVLGFAALGTTGVLLAGGLDLSIGAVSAFASIALAKLCATSALGAPLAMLVVVLGGATFGALQGWTIERLGLPAFIVTLAGMFLARGLALSIEIESISVADPTIGALSSFRAGLGSFAIGTSALAWIAATLAAVWVLALSRFGRRVYAVGGAPRAALLFGLPVSSTRIALYATSGACAALAGIAYVVYGSSGSATSGSGLELDALAAAVVGGTSLAGGVGGVFGTFVGVCLFGWIQNVILFEGTLGSGWTRVAAGTLLLAFVGVQSFLRRSANRT